MMNTHTKVYTSSMWHRCQTKHLNDFSKTLGDLELLDFGIFRPHWIESNTNPITRVAKVLSFVWIGKRERAARICIFCSSWKCNKRIFFWFQIPNLNMNPSNQWNFIPLSRCFFRSSNTKRVFWNEKASGP